MNKFLFVLNAGCAVGMFFTGSADTWACDACCMGALWCLCDELRGA